MPMLAFGTFSARRLVGQAAAIFGVTLTLALTLRWGPPGWEGPWPLRGGAERVMAGTEAGGTSSVGDLTLRVVPPQDGADVVLYRDGWRVGTLAGGPFQVAVHAGDTLSLDLRAPVRVAVDATAADTTIASPTGWWTLGPTQPGVRLPLVVLREGMGRVV